MRQFRSISRSLARNPRGDHTSFGFLVETPIRHSLSLPSTWKAGDDCIFETCRLQRNDRPIHTFRKNIYGGIFLPIIAWRNTKI